VCFACPSATTASVVPTPAHGSGLLGLKDRAEAIGGTISLLSPQAGGTTLHVELPLDDDNN